MTGKHIWSLVGGALIGASLVFARDCVALSDLRARHAVELRAARLTAVESRVDDLQRYATELTACARGNNSAGQVMHRIVVLDQLCRELFHLAPARVR